MCKYHSRIADRELNTDSMEQHTAQSCRTPWECRPTLRIPCLRFAIPRRTQPELSFAIILSCVAASQACRARVERGAQEYRRELQEPHSPFTFYRLPFKQEPWTESGYGSSPKECIPDSAAACRKAEGGRLTTRWRRAERNALKACRARALRPSLQ